MPAVKDLLCRDDYCHYQASAKGSPDVTVYEPDGRIEYVSTGSGRVSVLAGLFPGIPLWLDRAAIKSALPGAEEPKDGFEGAPALVLTKGALQTIFIFDPCPTPNHGRYAGTLLVHLPKGLAEIQRETTPGCGD
jgi:hypothetical protein